MESKKGNTIVSIILILDVDKLFFVGLGFCNALFVLLLLILLLLLCCHLGLNDDASNGTRKVQPIPQQVKAAR